MLEHLLHARSVLGDVDVLNGNLLFAVLLPGGSGVGSGVLAEDQNFLTHPRTLLVCCISCASRLLKKAHLPRWRARAGLRRTRKYASRLASRAALHLDLFEQPGRK